MRRNLPCLAILGLYIVCILVTNPKGEFPLNDDWSYSRSAFGLGSGHGLKIDPWAAPSVVGQALYGGLLTRIFSPRFLVLRVSTLVLSCCTILLLWGIFLRTGFRRDLASIALLAWAFNPLQFSLSFTYMTEVPFIFFVALALYLYTLHLGTGKGWTLLLSAGALGYAFLIRQTALLFVLALACSVLLDTRKSIWARIRHLAPVVLISACFVAGYYAWSHVDGGATVAVQRKFDLLSHIKSRQIIGNSYGMIFYLAFMLLPVWIFLIPYSRFLLQGFSRILQFAIPVVCGVIAAAGLWWFYVNYMPSEYLPAVSYHARMPFLLNVLWDTGLGPLTLDPDYFAPPPTATHPWAWGVITGMTAVGAALCANLCIFGLLRIWKDARNRRNPILVFALVCFLLLTVFEIVFSHLQEGGLFDRHILIVFFPFLLMIGILAPKAPRSAASCCRLQGVVPACLTIVILGAFCVAATHDYMEWNRIRWQMGRELLQKGVDPLSIVGGFEFNAWNNYDTFVARGRTTQTSHWWYDRRDYVITMKPIDGYEIRQARSYFSWVHRRPVRLYLIANPEI